MANHIESAREVPHALHAWIEDATLPVFVGEPYDVKVECEDPTPPFVGEERAKFILEWIASSEAVDIEPEVGAVAETGDTGDTGGLGPGWVRIAREVVQGAGPASCRFRITPRACDPASLYVSLILRCITPRASIDEIYRRLSIDLPIPEARTRSRRLER